MATGPQWSATFTPGNGLKWSAWQLDHAKFHTCVLALAVLPLRIHSTVLQRGEGSNHSLWIFDRSNDRSNIHSSFLPWLNYSTTLLNKPSHRSQRKTITLPSIAIFVTVKAHHVLVKLHFHFHDQAETCRICHETLSSVCSHGNVLDFNNYVISWKDFESSCLNSTVSVFHCFPVTTAVTALIAHKSSAKS